MTTSESHSSGQVTATGPLRVSAANPRYFTAAAGDTADQKAVCLTGSHLWNNLHDGMGPGAGCAEPAEPLDYGAYLDFLAEHGHNFIRLWRWEQVKSRRSPAKRGPSTAPRPPASARRRRRPAPGSCTSRGVRQRDRRRHPDRESAQRRATPEDRRATTAELSWMLWTAIGIGGVWVVVLLLSLLAPDLVSASFLQEEVAGRDQAAMP